jgi:hypothetical protein
VNHHARAGTRLFEAGAARSGEQRAALFAQSLAHHQRAARWGLAGVAAHQYQIALIRREAQDWAGAERHLRRALELDPEPVYPRLDLADVLIIGGRLAEAEAVLAELLGREPGFEPARARQAALHARRTDPSPDERARTPR